MGIKSRWRKLVNKPARNKLRGSFALDEFLIMSQDLESPKKCLDVGCGAGNHLNVVKASGIFKEVHGLNLNPEAPNMGEDAYFGLPIEDMPIPEQENDKYDAIWCCHVLEHTLTPGPFLKSIFNLLKEGGILCILVPPLKHEITVGHVTLWNPGLLLLNLLKAGFDCRDISMKMQGYNIAAIIEKKSLPKGIMGEELGFNPGYSRSARGYLPQNLTWRQNRNKNTWYFDGNFKDLNWPK